MIVEQLLEFAEELFWQVSKHFWGQVSGQVSGLVLVVGLFSGPECFLADLLVRRYGGNHRACSAFGRLKSLVPHWGFCRDGRLSLFRRQ